jgi:5-methylcytosine-specific restriction endonuclease McrA
MRHQVCNKDGPIAAKTPLMDIKSNEHRSAVVLNTRDVYRQRCRICGTRGRMEFDHYIPKSRGGLGLRLVCWRCNRLKSDKLLTDSQLRRWVRFRRAKARGTLFQEGWT